MTRFLTFLLFFGLVLTAGTVRVAAQFSDIKIGIGISSAWINGANPAREFMLPEKLQVIDDSTVFTPGGSLDGQQPGIGLRARFGIGDTSRFRMMLGFDYLFYRGNWRLPLEGGTVQMEHRVDMPTGLLGFEYVAHEFSPLARLYASAELRGAYLYSTFFDWEFRATDGTLIDERETTEGKPSTFRLGGALRVGLEGEFQKNLIVDTSIGYGAVNLAGRDDVRGELLTTNNLFETQESLLGNMLFSIMLMYRI